MPLIRVEYEKKGRVKYISHLDLIRVIQRAVRRAKIPVEYSKGFNPHAKISYGPALALGIGSDGEMMDIQLEREMEVEKFISRMNISLPDGFRIKRAEYMPDNSASLTALINAAEYSIRAQYKQTGAGQGVSVLDFFNRQHAYMEKTSKKGKKRVIDIMPMVLELKHVDVGEGEFYLNLILETGSKQNLKPSDLLSLIKDYAGLEITNTVIHREKLLVKRGDRYFTPFQVFN